MYFAMGLPHQHCKQFIVLAVCRGLFMAAALVKAMSKWWPETVVLPSTGQDGANTDLLNQWHGLVRQGKSQAGRAASRDEWNKTSMSLKRLKSESKMTAEDVSKVLDL